MTGTPRHSALDIARALGQHPPTPEQQQVIEAGQRPLLVVAGAGSGKTETMSARVVWLVANDLVAPDQVLGLTFTRKAAGELASRITTRLRQLVAAGLWVPPTDDGTGAEVLGGTPTVLTYHSYASRLVREHALRIGVEPDFRMLTEAGAWQLAAEAVHRYDGPMDLLTRRESTVIEAVMDLAGEMAEHLVGVDDVDEHLDRVLSAVAATPAAPKGSGPQTAHRDMVKDLAQRRQILPVVRSFLQLKRSRESMDFADQMSAAAGLVAAAPEVARVERDRFHAVLLDEFQDTSEAQLRLMHALFHDPAVSVTAVGDPNQSIYGWRGASSTTLLRFPEEFADAAGPGSLLPLSTSWRNDTAILAAANRVAGPLQARGVEPLSARPGAGEGLVVAARYETLAEEVTAVAGWVASLWRTPSGRRTGRTAAVLCRRRSLFPLVADALRDAGLPVEVVGLGGLLVTPEVGDLVAALTVIADPTRGDALMRLLTGPMARLGAGDLDVLWEWARVLRRRTTAQPGAGRDRTDLAPDSADEPTLAEALDSLPPAAWVGAGGVGLSAAALGRLHGLAQALRTLHRQLALPLVDLVGEVERELGLDVEVLARPEHTASTARVHLDAFADVASGYSATADRPTLAGFVAWLEAAREQERGLDAPVTDTDPDAVQVLTVHAAKGLEWDVVAVPAMVEGTFPDHDARSVRWDASAEEWTLGSQPRDKGWLGGLSALPWDLRGDRDGLPLLRWHDAGDLAELHRRIEQVRTLGGQRLVAEERRLAYVALTRARTHLLVSNHVWSERKTVNVTSRFLRELLEPAGPAPAASRVELGVWCPAPEPVRNDKGDPVPPPNPFIGEAVSALWPTDPMGERRVRLAAGAERVATLVAAGDVVDPTVQPPASRPRADDLETDLRVLLAERAVSTQPTDAVVTVPRHLSASSVVAFARDPQAFAMQLRRPMPRPPALEARRGTAFHSWVEQHYSRAAIVDLFDVPGSADEDPGAVDDLERQRATFLAGEWAQRVPVEIELAVETVVDGIAVRGRIDAVFERPDGGYTVVDWKTGPPATGEAARVRAIQLGAYALAYARLRGVPADRVDGAFVHVTTGQTIRPQLPSEQELTRLLRTIPE